MAKTTVSAQLSGSAKKPEYPGGYSDSLARQKGFEPPTFRLGELGKISKTAKNLLIVLILPRNPSNYLLKSSANIFQYQHLRLVFSVPLANS